jgi:hypothetical protein
VQPERPVTAVLADARERAAEHQEGQVRRVAQALGRDFEEVISRKEAEMMQILLCAGPGLLVVKKAGLLFFRRPGQPDAPVPYAPEHYPVFLKSASQKYGLTRVLGPSEEEAPCLPDEAPAPSLRRDYMASGEEVFRLEAAEAPCEEEGRHLGTAAAARVKHLTT